MISLLAIRCDLGYVVFISVFFYTIFSVLAKYVIPMDSSKTSVTCMHAFIPHHHEAGGCHDEAGGCHDVDSDSSCNFIFISVLDFLFHGYPWKIPVLHVIPSCTGQSPLSGGITWHTFFFAFSFFQNRITVHPMMMM